MLDLFEFGEGPFEPNSKKYCTKMIDASICNFFLEMNDCSQANKRKNRGFCTQPKKAKPYMLTLWPKIVSFYPCLGGFF